VNKSNKTKGFKNIEEVKSVPFPVDDLFPFAHYKSV
jgi:hypothetical protein